MDNMTDFALANILTMSVWLLLVGSAFLHFRERPATAVKYAVIWAVIIGTLALGWSLFY
jgi:hypothetical protein